MNIVLLKGVPTDLYAASGVAVGTQIRIQNQSEQLLTIAETQAGLARDASGNCLSVYHYHVATTKAGSIGAWARADSGDCLINLTVV